MNYGLYVYDDLPGWEFTVFEISSCVWRVRGMHADFRMVEAIGYHDPEPLLQRCVDAAKRRAAGL